MTVNAKGCGCGCDGVDTETPRSTHNRPGLSALRYRVGTHPAFARSMRARLSSREALLPLTTREPDDPAIALLDSWAVVADVLTFYQERIANEGYLRTATEQRSLDHLGALVGYTPRPPLAASTYLAYTVADKERTVVPAGSAVRNTPGQNALPQTYETSEELAARGEWNSLAVRRTDPPGLVYARPDEDVPGNAHRVPSLTLKGTTANLTAGDRLLMLFGDPVSDTDRRAVVRTVFSAKPDFDADTTAVALVSELDQFAAAVLTARTAVDKAVKDAPNGAEVAHVVQNELTPLGALLTPQLLPEAVFTNTIPARLDRLAEISALAEIHLSCTVRKWMNDQVANVIGTVGEVVARAAVLTRRNDLEMDQLIELAEDTLCPPEQGGGSKLAASVDLDDDCGCGCEPDPENCDRATALVALTPMLERLRRPPARPPRKARDVEPDLAELYRPDSDVHPKLLATAQPRIEANLHTAWRNQRITRPPALADLQAMRVKAKIGSVPDSGGGVGVAAAPTTELRLDTVYPAIVPGTWVVLETDKTHVLRVVGVRQALLPVTVGEEEVGTAPVTVVEVDRAVEQPAVGDLVFAQGESQTVLGEPIRTPVGGREIELARLYDGLRPGRWLVVSGERTDIPHTSGITAAELVMLGGIRQWVDATKPGDTVRTSLLLTTPLSYTYARDSVVINANVVEATQGETRDDVLGSGDAAVGGQAFALRQTSADNPLTWLPAPNPSGAEETLTVRVGGVEWRRTEAPLLAGPTEHVYSLGRGDVVRFGDGVHGARLPSGTENVTARYRTGAGRSGNAPAGSVNQLSSQPLHVQAVTNPVPATGGADGDRPGDARVTTPLRMRALDRLVSVRDYEDFTRARAGIGKAAARKLLDGGRQVVHVTIAGTGDVPIDPASALMAGLETALLRYGDLGVPVRVDVRQLVTLVIRAGVKLLPEYSWDLVEPAVRAALLAEFGFDRRELGQSAFLSEVFATVQRVPGVDYVDVDTLAGVPGDASPVDLATLLGRLEGAADCVPAPPARFRERHTRVRRRSDSFPETLTQVARRTGLTVLELLRLNPSLTRFDVGTRLTVASGVVPAQLAVLPPGLPEALMLRRIP
ncbi:putative baseplate assembly protein [Amycolatopsis suaedae]|uniref:Putative baseplate assembly protein n=1 Tax=Amycolatopsis suaedae TaxID=2510978 RepID=A0A4V2EL21_9PSEU|nr:putative baseplate assembly protein [Amycolatopsis suaedae]RZQ60045.1 putative baseplate assembly protein [Amycolatopsis suaedae]